MLLRLRVGAAGAQAEEAPSSTPSGPGRAWGHGTRPGAVANLYYLLCHCRCLGLIQWNTAKDKREEPGLEVSRRTQKLLAIAPACPWPLASGVHPNLGPAWPGRLQTQHRPRPGAQDLKGTLRMAAYFQKLAGRYTAGRSCHPLVRWPLRTTHQHTLGSGQRPQDLESQLWLPVVMGTCPALQTPQHRDTPHLQPHFPLDILLEPFTPHPTAPDRGSGQARCSSMSMVLST